MRWLLILFFSTAAFAQPYPSKPVRIVIARRRAIAGHNRLRRNVVMDLSYAR